MLRIHIPGITGAADNCDRVGNHRHLQGMLRIVLRLGVAHQAPAGDQLQAGQISKKSVRHTELLSGKYYTGETVMFQGGSVNQFPDDGCSAFVSDYRTTDIASIEKYRGIVYNA